MRFLTKAGRANWSANSLSTVGTKDNLHLSAAGNLVFDDKFIHHVSICMCFSKLKSVCFASFRDPDIDKGSSGDSRQFEKIV